jgi:hypothetical protein
MPVCGAADQVLLHQKGSPERAPLFVLSTVYTLNLGGIGENPEVFSAGPP